MMKFEVNSSKQSKVVDFYELEEHLIAAKKHWEAEIDKAQTEKDYLKVQYCIGRKHSASDMLSEIRCMNNETN